MMATHDRQAWADSALFDGSTRLQGFSDFINIPIDQVNFMACQALALGLSFIYREFFNPEKVTTTKRHVLALLAGLGISYICFGKACFTICMAYLSVIHVQRAMFNYGDYALDITGPLMILTQKVTSLAFSLHDGTVKDPNSLQELQKRHCVKRIPSILEYFSYCFNFQGILAGPFVFYNDYAEFVTGQNLKGGKHQKSSFGGGGGPSSLVAVTNKVCLSIFFALGVILIAPWFPVGFLKEEAFFEMNILRKVTYVVLITSIARWKYYTAWILADAICNASGLGFNGYTPQGLEKWDLISNVDIIPVEVGLNFRAIIEHWNKGTNRWLRATIYERFPVLPTVVTYIVSAIWHGLYPGYYLTFLCGAMFTISARTVRRTIRPYFLVSESWKWFYDVLTTVTTRVILAYATFPFALLEFWSSVDVYRSLYFFLHVASIGSIVLLPLTARSKPREGGSGKPGSSTHDSRLHRYKDNGKAPALGDPSYASPSSKTASMVSELPLEAESMKKSS
ncbi:unnamed protein product [Darwinula stevensoni]|uniref:Lysophospholipid acyltransferase 2 n=1 Tax=Darwinula stevensoni TaxID=69355 RepID=A0A7R8X427_9CRUS|nr:unnamed protein product [Darwinula stevensoni]CAG0883003.1 unnamed protein product [Darwinula stevensoni]